MIKIVEKRLGRERAVGQAFSGENLIEIDPNQTQKEYLFTLIHEIFHLLLPDATEKEVVRMEKIMGACLWTHGYRRIYQDKTKNSKRKNKKHSKS